MGLIKFVICLAIWAFVSKNMNNPDLSLLGTAIIMGGWIAHTDLTTKIVTDSEKN